MFTAFYENWFALVTYIGLETRGGLESTMTSRFDPNIYFRLIFKIFPLQNNPIVWCLQHTSKNLHARIRDGPTYFYS